MRTFTGFLLELTCFTEAPQFEVSSVMPHAPAQLGRSNITTSPGRLMVEKVDIKELIAYAYDVSRLVIAADLPATRLDAEGAHIRAEFRLML